MLENDIPLTDPRRWKLWPKGWYPAARAQELPVGKVKSGQLAGYDWIIYRGEDGVARATDAFCPHMGAHLQNATVCGETLCCGLHACQLQPSKNINHAVPRASEQYLLVRAWPCVEQFGLIWLHFPDPHPAPVPFAGLEAGYYWLNAKPRILAADWRALICNGFDLAHMQMVHQREVVGTPKFTRLAGSLRMSYATRILDRGGFSSTVMKRLSGGTVNLTHTCNTSSIFVQSWVGRLHAAAIFALLPQETSTTAPENRHTLAFAAIGIPRGARFPAIQLRIARALYLAFLRKDFQVVKRMRLQLHGVNDPGVNAVYTYQQSLLGMKEHV